MNRRNFIKNSSLSLTASLVLPNEKFLNKNSLPQNKICFLSAESWQSHFEKNLSNKNESTYTELDVLTGKTLHKVLPIEYGHYIHPINDDKNHIIVCPYLGSHLLIYDRKINKIISKIKSSENFLFSGHCCISNEFIFIPMKHFLFRHDSKTYGKILILEKASLKQVDELSSYGIWPHDICFFNNTIAVAHAGTNGPLTNPGKFQYDNTKSNVILLKEGKLFTEFGTNGFSPSHLAFSAQSNRIFFNSVQWLSINNSSLKLFERIYGFQFSLSEKLNNRISSSEPFFVIDLNTNKLIKLSLPINIGRRAVEIAVDDIRRCCYATFSHSDTLIKINFDGDIMEIKKAFDFGLTEVRGIDFLGNDYLVVSGKFRGIAILDRSTLDLIARFDVSTYSNTHLSVL